LTVEELEEARGARSPVVDRAGEPVGAFETVYYDNETGEPVWVGIRSATTSQRVLAPVEGAELAGGSVRLACARDAVESSEAVDEESIDAEAEAVLRAHYGLPPQVTRYEEALQVGTGTEAVGNVHVRKQVDTSTVEENVPREIEEAGLERVPVEGEDSGLVETLADGSVSIPVFEEQLVVTKRLVVRERVIVRKETRIEQDTVTTEIRRERVEIEADSGIELGGDLP
jgi:uncharacterized protein (TIGR02271 family)